MKTRKLGIALLIMLAFFVTTGTFAYWASGITGSNDTTSTSVTIGEAAAVTTTVTITGTSADTDLIPTGRGVDGTDDTVALTFPVIWEQAGGATDFDGTTGTLAVTFSNKALGTLTVAEIDAMFTFTVTSGAGAITEGSSQNVVVTVVFANEPATQAIYTQVANGTLSFDVTFTVTTS
jgi:hypothetical protein